MKILKIFAGVSTLFMLLLGINAWQLNGDPAIQGLSHGAYLMQVIKIPALLTLIGAGMLSIAVWSGKAEAAEKLQQEQQVEQEALQKAQAKMAAKEASKNFTVQLIGARLITPYIRRGLPLEAQLPALLSYQQNKKPKAYYAPATATNNDSDGYTTSYDAFTRTYLKNAIYPFNFSFWSARRESFFYNGLKWSEVKGDGTNDQTPESTNQIAVFCTLAKELAPAEGYRFLDQKGLMTWSYKDSPRVDDKAVLTEFEKTHASIKWQMDNAVGIKATDPKSTVHYRFGSASAGFSSLTQAFDYLESHPKEVVWVLAADARSFAPKIIHEQPNEASVLLLLAHQDFDTGRDPLALLSRPVKEDVSKDDRRSALERLKAVTSESLTRAKVEGQDLGRIVHDASNSKQLGMAAQVSTEIVGSGHLDWFKQQMNLSAWLGDLGAATTSYQVLMGAYAAFANNKPSIVLDINEAGEQWAMTISPPPNHQPPATRSYWGAMGDGAYSLPWWGKRRDGKPDFDMGPQPERKPEPPFALEYQ